MKRTGKRISKWSKLNRKLYPFVSAFIGVLVGYLVIFSLRTMVISSKMCRTSAVDNNIEDAENLDVGEYETARQVFVGVITAKKYLTTRAKAVYDSWGKNFPGTIGIFCSEDSRAEEGFPLVNLTGVDDSYPPQKKTFMMLKYMHDNLINDFEFFVKADDDAFIRDDKLRKFLSSVKSSNLLFIGQPGRGTKKEVGHLGLSGNEFFCMGGPTYIISRAVLRKIGPHIEKCIHECRTQHEDVEVWRCVHKYAGISCTSAEELSEVFYHNLKQENAFSGHLYPSKIGRTIALHPLKNHFLQYKMNYVAESIRIREKEHEILNATKEVNNFKNEFNLSVPSLDDAEAGVFFTSLGIENKKSEFNDQAWKRTEDDIMFDFDAEDVDEILHPAFNLINDDIFTILSNSVTRHHRLKIFEDIRVQKGIALELRMETLILAGKARMRKAKFSRASKFSRRKLRYKVMKKIFSHVKIPFGNLLVREASKENLVNVFPNEKETSWKITNKGAHNYNNEMVTIILHFVEPIEEFELFLDNYRAEIVEKKENVRLLVILSSSLSLSTETCVKNLISNFKVNSTQSNIDFIMMGNSATEAYMIHAALTHCKPSDLIFFTDPNVKFISSELMNRIRWFTVRGKQVYTPIPIKEYPPLSFKILRLNKPNPSNSLVDPESGYWDVNSFNYFAIYKSDLEAVLNVSIANEKLTFVQKIIKFQNISVARAPDPGLTQRSQSIQCRLSPSVMASMNLSRNDYYSECISERFEGFSSAKALTKYLLDNSQLLNKQFQKSRVKNKNGRQRNLVEFNGKLFYRGKQIENILNKEQENS